MTPYIEFGDHIFDVYAHRRKIWIPIRDLCMALKMPVNDTTLALMKCPWAVVDVVPAWYDPTQKVPVLLASRVPTFFRWARDSFEESPKKHRATSLATASVVAITGYCLRAVQANPTAFLPAPEGQA